MCACGWVREDIMKNTDVCLGQKKETIHQICKPLQLENFLSLNVIKQMSAHMVCNHHMWNYNFLKANNASLCRLNLFSWLSDCPIDASTDDKK